MASRPERHPAEPPDKLPPELAEFCRRLVENVQRKRDLQRAQEASANEGKQDGKLSG